MFTASASRKLTLLSSGVPIQGARPFARRKVTVFLPQREIFAFGDVWNLPGNGV